VPILIVASLVLSRVLPDSRTGTLISDRFDAPGGHWVIESTATITTSIEDGVYRMQVHPKDDGFSSAAFVKNGRYPHVIASVSARKRDANGPEALYGVDCWVAHDREYRFEIDPDALRYEIVRDQDGGTGELAQGLIPGGTLNGRGRFDRIVGECQEGPGGTDLQLLVNGTLVASQVDPSSLGSFKGIGLHVASVAGMSDVVFDDATLVSR
jgi:hypothetical protein